MWRLTQWGTTAGGERPWVDHGFLASGGTKLSCCSSRGWQHPLVLWGPEEGWVVLLHVWGVGWMSTMACDQEPFLPGLPPGGNPELDPSSSLSSQIEPRNSDKPPGISMCWLAATLYIPSVLAGSISPEPLLIGQHSFQCFVNLRDIPPLI